MKKELRKWAKEKRSTLCVEELSSQIKNQLVSSQVYQNAENIMCYYSVGTEVSTVSYFQDKTLSINSCNFAILQDARNITHSVWYYFVGKIGIVARVGVEPIAVTIFEWVVASPSHRLYYFIIRLRSEILFAARICLGNQS